MDISAIDPPSGPPSLAKQIGELTTGVQVFRLIAKSRTLREQPRGNGEPVTLLPGYLADSNSLLPLRWYLKYLGYNVGGWGIGMNRGDVPRMKEAVGEKIDRLATKLGRPISLVGWSLGGVVAREVARDHSASVKNVITFGTPVIGGPKYTATAARYEKRGFDLNAIAAEIAARDLIPIEVPVTSIFSKADGIVAWRASVDHLTPNADNIEVGGTHIGLGINPDVWAIIAQKLAKEAY